MFIIPRKGFYYFRFFFETYDVFMMKIIRFSDNLKGAES